MIIPTLVKILSITIKDRKISQNNLLLSEENKNKTHVNSYTDKTFDYLIWTFSNISNSNIIKNSFFNNNLIPIFLSILTSENTNLNCLIWRILGNLACGEDLSVQTIIEEGIIDHIKGYLQKDISMFSFKILKEVLFTVSNIASGTITQIKFLITNNIFIRIWELIVIFLEIDFYKFFQNQYERQDANKVIF